MFCLLAALIDERHNGPKNRQKIKFFSGERIEREDLMLVLTNLKGLYVKASYGFQEDGQARLSGVKLDSAEEIEDLDVDITNPVTR